VSTENRGRMRRSAYPLEITGLDIGRAMYHLLMRRYLGFCNAIYEDRDTLNGEVIEQVHIKRVLGYQCDKVTKAPVMVAFIEGGSQIPFMMPMVQSGGNAANVEPITAATRVARYLLWEKAVYSHSGIG